MEFERASIGVKQQQAAKQSLFGVVANCQKTYGWQGLRTAQGQPLSRSNRKYGIVGEVLTARRRHRDKPLVEKHRVVGKADLNTLVDREFQADFFDPAGNSRGLMTENPRQFSRTADILRSSVVPTFPPRTIHVTDPRVRGSLLSRIFVMTRPQRPIDVSPSFCIDVGATNTPNSPTEAI